MSQWQPSAEIDTLKRRAQFLQSIRQFFQERHVLEVETPALAQASIPDATIQSFATQLQVPGQPEKTYYLQTSPEFHMKRLLAAGSGPIFQIAKVFRNEEKGRLHNPEFTLLEWYRPGFDHHDLMNELDVLLQTVLHCQPADKISYRDLFIQYCDIDIATTSLKSLVDSLPHHQIFLDNPASLTVDDCLHLLLSHHIEPKLGLDKPVFIYDFPKSQAALAKVRKAEYPVAERFELYIQGTEIANGFHELCDAKEQKQRFEQDNQLRQERQINTMPICSRFIASLEHGLPACAGVAVGVDRLFLLAENRKQLSEVLAFDSDIA